MYDAVPILYVAAVLALCGLLARKSRRRMLKANERYNRDNRSRPHKGHMEGSTWQSDLLSMSYPRRSTRWRG